MRARHEITRKFAKQYQAATKNAKSKLLNEVCSITGWSRDNARRQLKAALKPRRVGMKKRKPRPLKYSHDALKILQQAWAFAGGISGKYLAASMELNLILLEAHGELVPGRGRYSDQVANELLAMSPATIDRYLAPTRAKDPLRGITTTTPGPLLRNSITVRKAGDEIENVPGFFEGDTVAHCGPVLKGEFCRTLDMTDMHTGWTYTRSIRNNSHLHIRDDLDRFISEVPFEVTGVDFDNGSEFINYDVIGWAADKKGRRKRVYDAPETPFIRLCKTGVLSAEKAAELTAYRNTLNPSGPHDHSAQVRVDFAGISKRVTGHVSRANLSEVPRRV